MSTIYDWVTVGLFAALIVLFLQRSTGREHKGDSLWKYLVAGLGCAAANWLGNNDQQIAALLVLAGTIGFVVVVLKPFEKTPE